MNIGSMTGPSKTGAQPKSIHMGGNKKLAIRQYRPGKWQVYFSHEGKQIHLQKDEKGYPLNSEGAATKLMLHISEHGYDPRLFGKDKTFQFDIAARTWVKLSTCEEWKIKRDKLVEKTFIPHFGKMDIGKIKTSHVNEFLLTLRERNLQPSYIRLIMGELRYLLKFNKVGQDIEWPKIPMQPQPIKSLTPEQQSQILQFIPDHHKPIYIFMMSYGTRLGEAAGLIQDNVHLEANPPYFILGSVITDNGKFKDHNKAYQLKIRPVIPELKWLFTNQNGNKFVFTVKDKPYGIQTIRGIWRRASIKANKTYGTPILNCYNSMRHSFATQRLNAGYTLDEVAAALGHSSTQMTKRYAAYTLERLTEIYKGVVVYNPFIDKKQPKLLEHKDYSKNSSIVDISVTRKG